ncbi:hypothetical protein ABPG74_020139 [Tetrahymena malaccensis]
MNILQKEFEMKCFKHPELPIQFINMQQNIDILDQQSVYLCEMCLSENLTIQPTQFISIKQIIENGEKQIIQQWPPLNNYQILQDLILKIKERQDKKSIESQITRFFAELKEEIIQQIDIYQKKIMNNVYNHSQILEQYQKISKINQLRDILIESKQNPQSKIQDLKRLLVDLQQEKEKNTTLLAGILNRSSLLDDQFKEENLNSFKSYALSFFKKLDIFCVENPQDIDQHQINFKDNYKDTQQLMKLKQIEMCFNEEQKPTNLRLKSNTILVYDEQSSNGLNRFGFVNPPIDKQKITRIQFKVLQHNCQVGLGICFAKTIQNKSYQFQYDQIGNGYYIISSNGYSWSHSRKDQHYLQKSFNFTKDHIICIEFNPIKKQLKFYNKFNSAKYNLDIEIPQNDELVFCVVLHVKGDEVEIINNQVDLNTIEFD